MKDLDWDRIATDGGWILHEAGGITQLGGIGVGRGILLQLLDPTVIESAISAALGGALGSEAARSVLRVLRPRAAIDRCLEFLQDSTDLDLRIASADLLGVLAAQERDALEIAARLLEDPEGAVALGRLDLLERRAWARGEDLPQIRLQLEKCAVRPEAVLRQRVALLESAIERLED